METKCQTYHRLPKLDQEKLWEKINSRMCGRSNVADILISKSDLPEYTFFIEVWKYNSNRGWSTNGYARKTKKGDWSINMNPTRSKKNYTGRTAKTDAW